MTSPMFELPPEEPERQPRRSPRQEEARFVEHFVYLLTAPPLAWPGWEDTLARHREELTLQRLVHHREVFDQEMCTEFEAMLYVSTVTLAHPVTHDWAEIYGWLFTRWKPEEGQEIWGQARELDRNQVDQLNRLRRWVYRQQLNHIRSRQRQTDQKTCGEMSRPP